MSGTHTRAHAQVYRYARRAVELIPHKRSWTYLCCAHAFPQRRAEKLQQALAHVLNAITLARVVRTRACVRGGICLNLCGVRNHRSPIARHVRAFACALAYCFNGRRCRRRCGVLKQQRERHTLILYGCPRATSLRDKFHLAATVGSSMKPAASSQQSDSEANETHVCHHRFF